MERVQIIFNGETHDTDKTCKNCIRNRNCMIKTAIRKYIMHENAGQCLSCCLYERKK